MNKKISRRSFLKNSFKFTIGTVLAGFAGHTYVKYIEPRWIDTTQHQITHRLIPPSFQNFTIVQFSDTHLGFHFNLKHLNEVINKINQLSPDLIIFSGDLVDNWLSFTEIDETVHILKQLKSKYGKIAVFGNHDHGGYGTEKYKDIMEESGFLLLRNEIQTIQINKEKILIAGIDDAMLGSPDFKTTFEGTDKSTYTILVSHAPDLADEAFNYNIHFQISGHSHGGQVKIPFFAPLITPPYGEKYYEGFYNITEDFTLYVNRGLGTTRLPFRLFTRPEITVFSLISEQEV